MSYQKRFLFSGIAILLLFSINSCFLFKSKKPVAEKTAEELYSEALKLYEKKDYEEAIPAFQKVIDLHPASTSAVLAELKKADSYFYLNKSEEARAAYLDFQRLHPLNKEIPYTIYQVGILYFNEVSTNDRDQSSTEKAIKEFKRLISQYPTSEYSGLAKEKLVTIIRKIAEYELYVGDFYFKNKNYKAALKRYEIAMKNYGGLGLDERILLSVAKTYQKLNETEKARTAVSSLLQFDGYLKYADEIRELLPKVDPQKTIKVELPKKSLKDKVRDFIAGETGVLTQIKEFFTP